MKFLRQGIKYDDLSEEEKEAWDNLDWNDEEAPDKVEAEALNKWLFSIDTVDKALEHLMTRGLKVEGGDRLGKTIIFTKNQAHAEFIQERFDANYPHYQGKFARLITFKTEYAQSLIDDFSLKDQAPHIAISVDMLDTGIDVPEVVNLVFFKMVRSKTKFWQMVGRGTRLCKNLFGSDQHKEFFYIFDLCQNLEFFNQNPEGIEGNVSESLSKCLFKRRLELMQALREASNAKTAEIREGADAFDALHGEISQHLHREVSAMPIENFMVRPHRRDVERFQNADTWQNLTSDDWWTLESKIAGLPTTLEPEDEEAKRFDGLMLRLQLALLRKQKTFAR